MRAYRSPLRLFIFGIIGIFLVVAAVDVMFGHWVSTVPETNDEGALTTRGQAQQRGDIVWGAALLGAGTLLFGGAVVELARRKPLVVVRDDGMVLAVGATEREVLVPWGHIKTIRGGVGEDVNDGGERSELILGLRSASDLPDEMIGARWNDPDLHVDASEWSEKVGDVQLAAQGALEYYRRVEAIGKMGAPSVTWETTVAGATEPISASQESDVKDERT